MVVELVDVVVELLAVVLVVDVELVVLVVVVLVAIVVVVAIVVLVVVEVVVVEVVVVVTIVLVVDVVVVEAVGAVVVVELVVVVVTGPHAPVSVGGKLRLSAGSVPQSSSRRSKTPSMSRSTPMRTPVSSGTAVKVSSWPAVAARLRTAVVESVASA